MSDDKLPVLSVLGNMLPLRVISGVLYTASFESDVWKILARTSDEKIEMFALKLTRNRELANDTWLAKKKAFYDFLTSRAEFAKFVIPTFYLKARMSAGDNAAPLCLQRFVRGRSLDEIADHELYDDPLIVRELLEFAIASIMILKYSFQYRTFIPDFSGHKISRHWFSPRYSKNIILADNPNKNGQRLYFIDPAPGHLSNKFAVIFLQRYIGTCFRIIQFKFWIRKLRKRLK